MMHTLQSLDLGLVGNGIACTHQKHISSAFFVGPKAALLINAASCSRGIIIGESVAKYGWKRGRGTGWTRSSIA
jgi:hypothetical protein